MNLCKCGDYTTILTYNYNTCNQKCATTVYTSVPYSRYAMLYIDINSA